MQKTKQLKNIGIILFTLGIVMAITSAAKTPVENGNYPDTVIFFSFSLFLGIVGNLLWHTNSKKLVKIKIQEHQGDSNSNPVKLLEQTVASIANLYNKAQSIQGMQLCHEVDVILDSYIHPFVDKRKTLLDMLGQSKGAEILLDAAYAERLLNRVWSAASDGHHQEALNSLHSSLENYKKALGKI
jgi:hypothetical protein